MDLKLSNYDLLIENGDVSFVTGSTAIGQDITMRLRTFLGESVYDQSLGVPYQNVIFQRGVALGTIEQILREYILQVPGVLGVESFTINSVDYQNRNLSITGRVSSIDGEIDFTENFESIGL